MSPAPTVEIEARRPVVPASHAELLDMPLDAVLTTEMPDGRLQSTVVWFSRDGDDLLVNTMREFRKASNLRDRPRATLLIPESPRAERWIEARGDVTLHEEGAREHLDALGRAYVGIEPFFGAVVPAEFARSEHPVVCRIRPRSIVAGPVELAAVDRPRTERRPELPARRGCGGETTIPATHRDLLERPLLAALSTRLRAGAQTHPVWFGLDGNDVLVNTTLERSKGRNLLRDPRATILVVDPENSSRWIEIRGDVDLETQGAIDDLDRVTRRYTPHPRFYGFVYPEERRSTESRVVARIHPRRIHVDAIHA